jgi:hypothetical protein
MTEDRQTDDKTSSDFQKSAEEWKELFRQLEQQVRTDAARMVGADESADWQDIGRQTGDTTRASAARSVGLDESASWERIGQELEREARSGVARFVGTSPQADWATIGQTVEAKVRLFLQDVFGPKKPKPQTRDEDDLVDPWA